MGRAMWSAEHSISSGERPRNSGLLYGNFSGRSDPGLPPPPELPPAIIPPMNPATADLTRVSMLAVRRGGGGVSVARCAAPRLPFPGFPPSSTALADDGLDGDERRRASADAGFIQSSIYSCNNPFIPSAVERHRQTPEAFGDENSEDAWV